MDMKFTIIATFFFIGIICFYFSTRLKMQERIALIVTTERIQRGKKGAFIRTIIFAYHNTYFKINFCVLY